MSTPPVAVPEGYTLVGEQLGSHPGGMVTGHGETYYWKIPISPHQVHNEILASVLYRLAGITVPKLRPALSPHGPGILSPWVAGADQPHLNDPAYMTELRRGFAVDVWLANWDVLGEPGTLTNIRTDEDGMPVRIDVGGALLFRARGGSKGEKFGPSPDEWDTMRASRNPASFAFRGMSDDELSDSAGLVAAVPLEQVRQAIEASGLSHKTQMKLEKTLAARHASIASHVREKGQG